MSKPHDMTDTLGTDHNSTPEVVCPPQTEHPFKGKTGITRLIHAFFNSMAGLEDAFRHESAFRQEILLAIFLVPLACVAHVSNVERALLIGSVMLVMIVGGFMLLTDAVLTVTWQEPVSALLNGREQSALAHANAEDLEELAPDKVRLLDAVAQAVWARDALLAARGFPAGDRGIVAADVGLAPVEE